jgi:hypothetical protein
MATNEPREILPYQQNRRPPRYELATVSFVFGVLSFAPIIVGWVIHLVHPLFVPFLGSMIVCCGPLFAMFAVFFGIIADDQIIKSKTLWRNRWMAVTGILLGIIVLMTGCVYL